MGEKPARRGKHLFLYCAGIIAILLSGYGCAVTSNIQKRVQGQNHMDLAQDYFVKGDYEAALNEYEKAAVLFPEKAPGDSALFQMGIAWVHPGNPDRNYKNALECFQKIVSDFPDSPHRERAEAWSAAIEEVTRNRRKIKDLEEQLDILKEIDISTEKKKREE